MDPSALSPLNPSVRSPFYPSPFVAVHVRLRVRARFPTVLVSRSTILISVAPPRSFPPATGFDRQFYRQRDDRMILNRRGE